MRVRASDARERDGTEPAHADARRARRRRRERLWLAIALTYSACRIFLVQTFLARYGVNVWLYAAVDLGSTVPYAIGSARTVTALVDGDRRRAVAWGTIAAAAFVAPDLTIVLSGGRLPTTVYVVLAVVLIGFGSVAASRLAKQVTARRMRRAPTAG